MRIRILSRIRDQDGLQDNNGVFRRHEPKAPSRRDLIRSGMSKDKVAAFRRSNKSIDES